MRPKFTDQQTLTELEFPLILSRLEEYAVSENAKNILTNLVPTNQFQSIILNLGTVSERLDIRQSNMVFPAMDFESLDVELKILGIVDSAISIEGIFRIKRASELVNALLKFFEKNTVFPKLHSLVSSCHYTEEIIRPIEKVMDPRGKIKDDASPLLLEIRTEIKKIRNQINRNFEKEMRRLVKEGVLGETYEGFIHERRVLTVQATYKRKVPGNILGSSKTGSLTYIEPQINASLNNELAWLIDDEKKEIYRILQALTKVLRGFFPLINDYQKALVALDVVNAKAKLADEMNAILPEICDDLTLDWKDAVHPILRWNNQKNKKNTVAQTLRLSNKQRMLVISGPNAGGKSITLKTCGLLQCMLQAGLLIPVDKNSKTCLFQQLYSDIGDNQSIDNELSTYSYRLNRMKYFLEVANRRTLLLLDEFGTGSDPELGSALAEVFFEEMYKSKTFAILTTHYASIKRKAAELPESFNGSMRFDGHKLTPLFSLELGQPGSSFTFEVASLNGINAEIINRAKSKLSKETVKFNQLLGSLQSEKTALQKSIAKYKESEKSMTASLKANELKSEEFQQKSKQIKGLLEQNTRWIQLGQKFQKYLERYHAGPRKKAANDLLFEEIRGYMLKEKTKSQPQKKAITSTPAKENASKEKITFQVGDKVRVIGSRQVAVVESLTDDIAVVSVKSLKMKVDLLKLTPILK
jgi:DNA mismatch repair protein MutS2